MWRLGKCSGQARESWYNHIYRHLVGLGTVPVVFDSGFVIVLATAKLGRKKA